MDTIARYLDQPLLAPSIVSMRRMDYVYASSLGFLTAGGAVLANCRRQEWYRMMRVQRETADDAAGLRRMAYGNACEAVEIRLAKQARIYVGDQIAVIDDEHRISGKIDLVVIDPTATTDPYVGIEIKSTSAWGAKGVITPNTRGQCRPKLNHVAQETFYAWCYRKAIPTWMIRYLDRGNGESRNHPTALTAAGDISVNGQLTGRNVSEILAWADSLWECVKEQREPPKDLKLLWDKDELKAKAEAGEFAKTDTDKALRGNRLYRGDPNCRWCKHVHRCHQGVQLPYGLELDEALAKFRR